MKLLFIKLFQILIFFSLLLIFVPEKANAVVPQIMGHVVTSTGAPVEGVWVKWTDGEGNVYYEKTDNTGYYMFDSGKMAYAPKGKMIDTDLNGVNDTYQGVIAPGSSEDRSHGCATNPHTFSVVLPVGWSGTFSVYSGFNFDNGQYNIVLPDLIYTPSVAPTATPIPPTPIPPNSFTKVVNFGIYPASGISGTVFIDTNLNGLQDGGESVYPGGVTITVTGASYAQTTTDGSGNYSFPSLPVGTYTVYETVPNGYSSTTPTDKTITIPPAAVANFGFVGGYTVKGSVFNDVNKNQKPDSGEPLITNYSLSATGNGTLNLYSNGTYDIQDLKAGNYTISYTSPLPPGYLMVYPKNGPPPSFVFTVGPGCTVDATTGATCNGGGNIDNLNFAITNSLPWMQTYNSDVRFDNGITDSIPKAPTCPLFFSAQDANATSPGNIFPGDSSSDFSLGSVSSTNWLSGGTIYPEVYSSASSIKTSYNYISNKTQQSGVTPVDITTVAGCANLLSCTLPGNLQNGVYKANGDLVLHAISFPNNRNFIFLVSGNLTFKGNVQVPTSSTVLFTASGDMMVDNSVSAAANICPVPSGQLQGFFSTDKNFIIQGNNDCIVGSDKMLNVEGSIIINAEHSGGKLINKRDLCGANPLVPSFTIKPRLDFILNAPQFLMDQSSISNEVAP